MTDLLMWRKIEDELQSRIVNVFADLSGIDFDWVGLQSLVQVERIGMRQGKPYNQTNYYISSLSTSALAFALLNSLTLGN